MLLYWMSQLDSSKEEVRMAYAAKSLSIEELVRWSSEPNLTVDEAAEVVGPTEDASEAKPIDGAGSSEGAAAISESVDLATLLAWIEKLEHELALTPPTPPALPP